MLRCCFYGVVEDSQGVGPIYKETSGWKAIKNNLYSEGPGFVAC